MLVMYNSRILSTLVECISWKMKLSLSRWLVEPAVMSLMESVCVLPWKWKSLGTCTYLRPVETLSFTCLSWSLPTFTADDSVAELPAVEVVLPVEWLWLELANISESERAPVSQKLLSPASVVRLGRVVMMMASMTDLAKYLRATPNRR